MLLSFIIEYPYQDQIAASKGSLLLVLVVMCIGLFLQIRQSKKLQEKVEAFSYEQSNRAQIETDKSTELNKGIESISSALTTNRTRFKTAFVDTTRYAHDS